MTPLNIETLVQRINKERIQMFAKRHGLVFDDSGSALYDFAQDIVTVAVALAIAEVSYALYEPTQEITDMLFATNQNTINLAQDLIKGSKETNNEYTKTD